MADKRKWDGFMYYIGSNGLRIMAWGILILCTFYVIEFPPVYLWVLGVFPIKGYTFIILLVGINIVLMFPMAWSPWLAYKLQLRAIDSQYPEWTKEDLALRQTRKISLKTDTKEAFSICKKACQALPDCKVVLDNQKSGQLRAIRGSLFSSKSPYCKIDGVVVEKEKDRMEVTLISQPAVLLQLTDKGANLANVNVMMEYLESKYSNVMEPVMMKERKGSDYLEED
jgi:hypothetical protein